jgi:hypothetical protein
MKMKTKEIKKSNTRLSFEDIPVWGLFRFPGCIRDVCLKIDNHRYISIGDEPREGAISVGAVVRVIKLGGELTWWEV